MIWDVARDWKGKILKILEELENGKGNFSFLSCAVVLNGKKTREKRNFVEDNDLPNNIGEFEKFNSAFEIKIRDSLSSIPHTN